MEMNIPDIEVERLSAAAFAPFGEVIEHTGGERRRYIQDAFTAVPPATRPTMWISRFDTPAVLPVSIETMERHPYATQTFVPMGSCRYLTVVTRDTGDGRPDPSCIRAFVAQASQGITYHRNVWHAGMMVLDAPACLVVGMSRTGTGEDDVFVDLSRAVRICAARS
jgi:ureidoglycolate lyase